MAHEIESMAYTGETPWHRLGTKVDHLMTAEEAIKTAGLGWTVSIEDSYVMRNGVYINQENHKFIKRDTDNKVLGRCGKVYTPIQNAEAFRFADGVVGSKEGHYETAGSLRGGERIWLLMNLKGKLNVKGEEIAEYLTLTNSHDGYNACQMFFTPVRVVCMNTLRMAISGATGSFYARHTTNVHDKIGEAKEILGFANKFFDKWLEQANAMAMKQLPPAQMPLLLAAAFGTTGAVDVQKVYAPTQFKMDRIRELAEVGKGMGNPAIKGTIWQAYNAVAEYADYERPYRNPNPEARLNGTWFGGGAEMKSKAWDFCLKLL